eukprot:1526826-Lingulodinium_polyedra.AAC.1
MDPQEVKRRQLEGEILLRFAIQIYEMQLAAGRHFLHEHPAAAASWQDDRMVRLRARAGVGEVVGDQCQYGLKAAGPNGNPAPALKPTRFLSCPRRTQQTLQGGAFAPEVGGQPG